MDKIDKIYRKLCRDLMDHGTVVGNTKELRNIKITLPDITKNIVSIRNISPAYLFGEWLWYFSGDNSLEFISKFGPMWNQMSDDGKTCNSAYGYIMQKKFGFNQVEKVIELLSNDRDSRRAVINLNTPNEKVIETNDEPCTIGLQFYVRHDALFCTCMMRSNDIWYGFPYDVAFFTELQKYIADGLGLEYGSYTHFVVSMHAYDRNWQAIQKIAENPVSKPIIFDRDLFHDRFWAIYQIMKLTTQFCDSKETKKMMLSVAQSFGYKEN